MKKMLVAVIILLLLLSAIYLANTLYLPQRQYNSPTEYYGKYTAKAPIISDNETNVIAQIMTDTESLYIILYKNTYTNLGGHDYTANAFSVDTQERYEFSPYGFKVEKDTEYLYLVPLTPVEKLYLLTMADQAVYDENIMTFWDKLKALTTYDTPKWITEEFS